MLKTRYFPNIQLIMKKHYSPSLDAMSDFSSTVVSMSNPTPIHFPDSPLAIKLQRPLFQPSHWSMRHMAHYKFPTADYHSGTS